jgi:uncharacterized protein (TIGR02186 family)
MRAVVLATLLIGLALPASAEQLISSISRPEVSITSSFQGETLTFFGNIEPEPGAAQQVLTGPYHIVIVVTGPLQNRVVRRKSNFAGVWLNSREVRYDGIPSFFHILSDAKLTSITSQAALDDLMISPVRQAQVAARDNWEGGQAFSTHVVRLMEDAGLYGTHEQAVQFRSDTFYSAQVVLASDVPPGPYIAHTYLFRNGELIADRAEGFSVRKSGFERFLGLAAVQQPLLYGIAAVVLALFTGWLGGVVFRR